MKPFFKILLPVFVLFLSLTGCKKDKEETRSRAELLSSAPWKQSAGTSTRLSDGTTADVYTPLQPCRKDDEFVFAGNNAFSQTEGVTKCNPADPQVQYTGTWSLVSNEAAVLITGGSGAPPITARILELTPTTMKLENTEGGYTVTVSYRH